MFTDSLLSARSAPGDNRAANVNKVHPYLEEDSEERHEK